jgi:2'-5' RNA ligase
MQRYYIAIILPEPLQTEVTAFKTDIHQRFGAKSALKSPAHITLFPPFNWNNEEENVLKTTLDGFVLQNQIGKRPLSISLKNFGFFRQSTVFVQLEANENLSILRGALLTYLATHIGLSDEKDAARPFHPHITIVNRDISEADFETIWGEYSSKIFEKTFVPTAISLLWHNGKRWQVVHEATF